MSPKEIKALVKVLRAQGITHYKTAEIELNLAPQLPKMRKTKLTFAEVEKIKEIKHKTEEFTSLMKLSDGDLVDRLFPDTQDEIDEVELQ